jgi:hypothetical protein
MRLALMPAAGSKTNTREACRSDTGSFGLISLVRKMRNVGDGVEESKRFSKRTRYPGARCTFFNMTHLPVLDAAAMALSDSASACEQDEPLKWWTKKMPTQQACKMEENHRSKGTWHI